MNAFTLNKLTIPLIDVKQVVHKGFSVQTNPSFAAATNQKYTLTLSCILAKAHFLHKNSKTLKLPLVVPSSITNIELVPTTKSQLDYHFLALFFEGPVMAICNLLVSKHA